MTRPRKQTVDWFPHSCTHGKTIFVLEKKYGVSGYAFWFKVLELLGNAEGHYINLNNPSTLEYLQAYTHIDNDICFEILNLLATLDAVDPELWNKGKIIWSENFVRGIAQAYRNRNIKIPVKEDIYSKEPGLSGISGTNKRKKPVEELEEGDRRKRKKIFASSSPPSGGSEDALLRFSCKHFDVTEDYFIDLLKDYSGLTDKILALELKKMRDWLDDNPHRHKRTAKGHLKNPKNFIRNWLTKVVVEPEKSTGKKRTQPDARTPDPKCPVCRGTGWEHYEKDKMKYSRKCNCWEKDGQGQ